MAETGTFSAAVDNIVQRSGRIDRRDDIISHVRRVILDCQTIETFENDFEEDRLQGTSDPFMWQLRINLQFRQMKTVRYPDVRDPQGKIIYANNVIPSERLNEEDFYWYQSGNVLVFYGHGAGNHIDIGYYKFLPLLPYYENESDRPAVWDVATLSWNYPARGTLTEEAAQALVTNWVLFNFFEIVVDGGLNFVFSDVGDERSRTSFAKYQAGKIIIQRAIGEGGA